MTARTKMKLKKAAIWKPLIIALAVVLLVGAGAAVVYRFAYPPAPECSMEATSQQGAQQGTQQGTKQEMKEMCK